MAKNGEMLFPKIGKGRLRKMLQSGASGVAQHLSEFAARNGVFRTAPGNPFGWAFDLAERLLGSVDIRTQLQGVELRADSPLGADEFELVYRQIGEAYQQRQNLSSQRALEGAGPLEALAALCYRIFNQPQTA